MTVLSFVVPGHGYHQGHGCSFTSRSAAATLRFPEENTLDLAQIRRTVTCPAGKPELPTRGCRYHLALLPVELGVVGPAELASPHRLAAALLVARFLVLGKLGRQLLSNKTDPRPRAEADDSRPNGIGSVSGRVLVPLVGRSQTQRLGQPRLPGCRAGR
jgi:hypothetical protein